MSQTRPKRRRYRYRSRAEAEDAQAETARELTRHELAVYDLATGKTTWLTEGVHSLGVSRLTGAMGGIVIWRETTDSGPTVHGTYYLDDLRRDARHQVEHGIDGAYPIHRLTERAARMRSIEFDGGLGSGTDGGLG